MTYISQVKSKPKFKCPQCNKLTELDFSPFKHKKWSAFKCPKCKYKPYKLND